MTCQEEYKCIGKKKKKKEWPILPIKEYILTDE
jgi:hypothetical protein